MSSFTTANFTLSSRSGVFARKSKPKRHSTRGRSLAGLFVTPVALGLRTKSISLSLACIYNIIMFKKKIVKNKGTQRVREDDDFATQETPLSGADSVPLANSAGQSASNQDDNEIEYKPDEIMPMKKRDSSKGSIKRLPRGLVHQGSYSVNPSTTFQTVSQVDQGAEVFAQKTEDIEMAEEGKVIDQEMMLQEDSFVTPEQERQILRAKELRETARKLQQNPDYIQLQNNRQNPFTSKSDKESLITLEAQLLQRKLIHERYQASKIDNSAQDYKRVRGIFDADSIMYTNEIEEADNQDEVEAFIKKRVKDGSGRDYDAIVNKDLINYRGGHQSAATELSTEGDYSNFTKFEGSKQYKNIQKLMELDQDDVTKEIDAEIDLLKEAIERNEAKSKEFAEQLLTSGTQIKEAEATFNQVGEIFVNAKEACDVIEDLQDMLTEKNSVIKEIMGRMQEIEQGILGSCEMSLICHVADVFQELGERQSPFAYTNHFNEALEQADSRLAQERKIFRQVNQQLDDQGILWSSVFENARVCQLRRLREVNFDSQKVFEDADDSFKSLKNSLYKALNQMKGVEGFQFKLEELTDFVVPYLQVEYLSDTDCSEGIQLIDLNASTVMSELAQYLSENHKNQSTELEQRCLYSSIYRKALHPFMKNFVQYVWNPLDPLESQNIASYLKTYVDTIFVEDSSNQSIGMKQVQDLIETIIYRLRNTMDYFHLTPTTSTSNILLNGLVSLISSTLAFVDIVPASNIEHLIVEHLLISNFLKALGKRVHKLAVESQSIAPSSQGVNSLEKEQIQLALDYLINENAQAKAYLKAIIQQDESGVEGLKTDREKTLSAGRTKLVETLQELRQKAGLQLKWLDSEF